MPGEGLGTSTPRPTLWRRKNRRRRPDLRRGSGVMSTSPAENAAEVAYQRLCRLLRSSLGLASASSSRAVGSRGAATRWGHATPRAASASLRVATGRSAKPGASAAARGRRRASRRNRSEHPRAYSLCLIVMAACGQSCRRMAADARISIWPKAGQDHFQDHVRTECLPACSERQ
jgi:hypothetical protein